MKKIDIDKTIGYYLVFGSFEYGMMFQLRNKVYSYVGYVLDKGDAIIVAKDCATGKYALLPVIDYRNAKFRLL